ncbi:ATP-binding protein [Clostridium butyricum]|uniref:ATP-binding protein n=1 Tax=Clostridium butyricum TaxID=1492 RepID=UPI0024BAF9F0|nr:ATP-binding protein [Clostridium butyricum]
MIENGGFTKAFGISNLIKGVSILDSIEYLIENSIDAVEKSMSEILDKKYIINIQINSKKITISDNCLGMTYDNAQKNLLKIGKKIEFEDKWGEGLKKSMFVLGKNIDIKSTSNIDKFHLNIKIANENDEKLWRTTFTKLEKDKEESVGFSVEITQFTNKLKNYLMNKGITTISNRLSIKYREIIKDGRITIIFNGKKLKPIFYTAKKVYEGKEKIIEGQKVKVILFNEIKNKENNGVDFIFNDRVILEKDKSRNINWRKRIIIKNHSYTNFYAEVIIKSTDIKTSGINPSHNNIDFNNEFIKKVINFFNNEIDNNREFYKKATTIVQVEVAIDDLNIWKEQLEKYEGECRYANDVIEKLYKKGVNEIMKW